MTSIESNVTTMALPGPIGTIEALIDTPPGPIRGIAVITHPHPLQGGNAEHKIPQLFAKIFRQHGWLAVRPNFRGVGGTEGEHNGGQGETEDTLAIIDAMHRVHPDTPIALAGFSFGAFVQARVARTLMDTKASPACIILAGVPFGTVQRERQYATPAVGADALVIHGEADPVAPLASVLDWARPQRLPVVVIPGANHFFTSYLNAFSAIVERHLISLR
ncbi:alpha/beta hydrolase [Burkholderia cenocepacia]|uniref:alpha/beta hydrolase n=1 Tax=Burkholderia cenocepacia TaxID=95486 RepID=UPI001CF52515|nr:alpha/beta family hydrolase [Burkholderia cenocepacia]MCA8009783.1 GntR family transcriptional regulator [Burkholderia cenocepacia]